MASSGEPQLLRRLRDAHATCRPLLAFNVFDLASARGVLTAARMCRVPVIVQFSSRTVSQLSAETLLGMVRREAKKLGVEAFVHLDHCRDPKMLEEAIDAGFDGVMADGSHLDIDSNVDFTRSWVARGSTKGVVVEAEFSAIPGIEDGITAGALCSRIDVLQFRKFCDATKSWLVGADVGTHHGPYTTAPTIDFAAIEELVSLGRAGIVIHGGSGLPAGTLRRLALIGVTKINFSTDLKAAWFTGVSSERSAQEPLAALQRAESAIESMAVTKWRATTGELG